MSPHTEGELTARQVVKSFGATKALRGADLMLHPGEVHALMGENGAGKSTFVKILVGALQPDSGELRLGGRPLRLSGVRDAVERGIVPIHQHLTLMPHLSVSENLFAFELADGGWFRRLPRQATAERARLMLDRVGLTIDPRTPVAQLSLAQRQLVEIARGVGRHCRVLVLDEPTAALNRAEADRLFAVVQALCSNGTAVLFISHKIDEVLDIADRVSVLRDGRTIVAGASHRSLSGDAIVEAMIGRRVEATKNRARPLPGDPVLQAEALSAPGKFQDISLTVRRREIVGIVGLIGSGALELGAAIAGAQTVAGGRLRVAGRSIRCGDRSAARAAGIGFVPADREQEGVFPGLSVLANGSASALREVAPAGWLAPSREARRILPWIGRLSVSPSDSRLAVQHLSGGNQQKVLVLRNLAMARLDLLVALEPTRGVDVGAREAIHRALVDAAEAGAGSVVVSSDLEEVLALSHRILVMRAGRIVDELPGESDASLVLARLTGAAP